MCNKIRPLWILCNKKFPCYHCAKNKGYISFCINWFNANLVSFLHTYTLKHYFSRFFDGFLLKASKKIYLHSKSESKSALKYLIKTKTEHLWTSDSVFCYSVFSSLPPFRLNPWGYTIWAARLPGLSLRVYFFWLHSISSCWWIP